MLLLRKAGCEPTVIRDSAEYTPAAYASRFGALPPRAVASITAMAGRGAALAAPTAPIFAAVGKKPTPLAAAALSREASANSMRKVVDAQPNSVTLSSGRRSMLKLVASSGTSAERKAAQDLLASNRS